MKKTRPLAPPNNRKQDVSRDAIFRATPQLISQLYKNVMGTLEKWDPKKKEMVPHALTLAQVRSAEVLLKKVLPDVVQTELRHTDEYSQMDKTQILDRIQYLLKTYPDVATRVGIPGNGKLIEGEAKRPDGPPEKTECH